MRAPLTALLGTAMALACGLASATVFQLAPVKLPGGITVSGTVTTDGTIGPLTAANLTDWSVSVRQVQRFVFDPSHPGVQVSGVSVSADGRKMSVRTSPDGVNDGGLLAFGSFGPGPEYGVQVANFTGAYADGGVAFYLAGPAFEWQWLSAPNASKRLVAKAAPGSSVFRLVPVGFPSGAVMSGTITTDGRTGAIEASAITDWKITAALVDEVRYTPANSSVLPATAGLSSDGTTLSVARPGGYFGVGIAPRPPARGQGAVPADFASATAPSGGQAGYWNAFTFQYVGLHFKGSAWPIATVQP
ncbi:hypothetical protein [Ideonella alba]|uniref:Uncharacterized protein n=1 Tax=Ideonella alba TaxID=2824118 RepID=A0A940Y6P2_9BURK|nr:hypothetical protein [Ideonella alba]MBQ0929260.1 hypothetical protein [Ideonella alba]